MEQGYNELLDRAWGSLPDNLKEHSRFEIPKADTFIEGNQTTIRNFNEIANALGRDPKYLMTYLFKELAAPGVYDGNRVVIQRVLKQGVIEQKINAYALEYVICHECQRPDTEIAELAGQKIIKCQACGAWKPMRRIK
ncbi:MAG: translation initiation factor IF-2 subunit beta [Candidatus Altiarchaeales archaeon IMC4]|nr:MAG: translation initiation factor IF-2 subunit beta [Candidatus Altiarchaeales archaeon IMC4]